VIKRGFKGDLASSSRTIDRSIEMVGNLKSDRGDLPIPISTNSFGFEGSALSPGLVAALDSPGRDWNLAGQILPGIFEGSNGTLARSLELSTDQLDAGGRRAHAGVGIPGDRSGPGRTE
jgi:hypothetical protein